MNDLKERIRAAQVRAVVAVNRELVLLYWSVGRDILVGQKEQGWGSKVIDLFFYHLRLRAYIIIDLTAGDFKPEFSGKMDFYLSAVDGLLRHPDDQPSIGIILCKTKNKVVAKYTLRDLRKPVGVSEYRLTVALPNDLRGNLPTIGELKSKLREKVGA